MLQPPQLKDHVQTIGIDPSLSNNTIYEHKCLENIKKLYKHAGNRDGKQQLKDFIEADMVYALEGFTENSPISPSTSTPVKKPSARKSLSMFTNILDVKKLLIVKLELLNKSAGQLNMEIHHGHWNKSEKGIQKSMNR